MGKVILFVGPPGSGKGTLSQKCVRELAWEQVSTGDMCRAHIANKTEIGQKIDFAIKSGKLVSDGLISQMVFDWFEKRENTDRTVILDGYPRTVQQAEDFSKLLRIMPIDASVARFIIDDEEVIDRLSNRYVCKNKSCQRVYSLKTPALSPKKDMTCDNCGEPVVRRNDDAPEAIKERLKVYHQHEDKLLEYLKSAGFNVVDIKGDQPIDVLFSAFIGKVEA